jgi:RNA ligase (TIGR02306 family)
MSSLVVEVCRISDVVPHPDPEVERLDLAQIKGWQCVVPRGKYHDGNLVVYIPPDSLVPEPLAQRWGVTAYLSKGRVRQVRLKGEPSFGLVVDVEDPSWTEGTDVAEYFGITKYEPPIKYMAGDAERPDPMFISYTDIENLRNFPEVLRAGEEVVLTEKIHGTNCRVGVVEGEVMAGSMEVRRKRPEDLATNTYWHPLTVPGVAALLEELGGRHKQAILFGEVYGARVQSLDYGHKKDVGFTAFDLMLDGKYLDYDEFASTCARYGVPLVPLLYRGPFSISVAKEHSSGNTTLDADHIREGVVIRPVIERIDPKIGRVCLKYLGDQYLLAKGITDSKDV